MKLYLTDTLVNVLNDLKDALRGTSSKDAEFKLELDESELTLQFDESVYFDLLGTDFERYFTGNDDKLTIDLLYYDF
jgi:hypothetical protein